MAKIIYKEGQEPLSGIYCGIMYRSYANGTNTAVVQPLPSKEDAKKNPALRAERIVKLCVIEIQRQMKNPYEAIKQYTNITHRVRRLYGELYRLEKKESKLIHMILEAYHQNRRVLPSRKVAHPRLDFDGQSTDIGTIMAR